MPQFCYFSTEGQLILVFSYTIHTINIIIVVLFIYLSCTYSPGYRGWRIALIKKTIFQSWFLLSLRREGKKIDWNFPQDWKIDILYFKFYYRSFTVDTNQTFPAATSFTLNWLTSEMLLLWRSYRKCSVLDTGLAELQCYPWIKTGLINQIWTYSAVFVQYKQKWPQWAETAAGNRLMIHVLAQGHGSWGR